MNNAPPRFTDSASALSPANLQRYADGWFLSGEINQHSSRTLDARKSIVAKLIWFLRQQELPECDTHALRLFLAYLTNGHKTERGRWGNPLMVKPVRPRTVHTYHGHLRTFFRWLVAEDVIAVSPMERIPVPMARADQIQPFSSDQVRLLVDAARRTGHSRRDEAIILFLLDTGLRASELCGIRRADLDFQNRRCNVLGKGNKRRGVPFGKVATKALWAYLKDDPRDADDPLFLSASGDALTRSGLLQIFERLGQASRIEAVRCSPHTLRHTFAVEYLRAGGNVFALQQILGHTSIQMTNRYVALAQADIEAQHRQFSPADRLRTNRN